MEASEQGTRLLAAWKIWRADLAALAASGGQPEAAGEGSSGGGGLVAASDTLWSLLGSGGDTSSALELWRSVARCAGVEL